MRVAVPYEHGMVNPHFGHTEQFKFYDIEDGVITRCFLANALGGGHEHMKMYLQACGVDKVICGNIGQGALSAMQQIGVEVYAHVRMACDEAVLALLSNTLTYSTEANCDEEEDGCGCAGGCGGCHGCGG